MAGQAKIFTTRPGDVHRIGHYGWAENESPAIVPEEVAKEFDGKPEYRVERESEPRKASKHAKEKE